MNDDNARCAQELEEERSLALLLALDECQCKGVCTESMRLLMYETGAGSLPNRFQPGDTNG